ncbi:hypothetical protein BDF19DRAFT_423236 [Syncephalis fuscata]|nr:hypothetical protein BDF19DRAFT_423236 [Syncephalis fuscata]
MENEHTSLLQPPIHGSNSNNINDNDEDAIIENKTVKPSSVLDATERDALLPSSERVENASWHSDGTIKDEEREEDTIIVRPWAYYIRVVLIVFFVLLLFSLCSLLLLLLLVPKVAQRSIELAEIRLDNLDMSEMSTDSLRFVGQMTVVTTTIGYWYTGQIESTVMQVVTKAANKAIGNMTVPAIKLDGSGTTSIQLNSTLNIADQESMAHLVKELLVYSQVSLQLQGKIALLSHGVRLSNLLFEKTIPIQGLNGLKKMDIEQLDLPRDHPKGGIEMTVTINIENPAQTALHMPSLALVTFYNTIRLSELFTLPWSLYPGTNFITFTGRLLPQSGSNIDQLNRFMSSYMAGNTTTVQVRGAEHATNGSVPWLDKALQQLTLHATIPGLPGSKSDFIKKISKMDLDLDFTRPDFAYHPKMNGLVIMPLRKLPFGFPLQIAQLELDVNFKQKNQAFAHLHVPSALVNTWKEHESTFLGFNMTGRTLDVLPGRTAIFEAFMADVLLQPSVNLSLSGSSTVRMNTAAGSLTISSLPVKLTSNLPGMDGFRHSPLTISQLSIDSGTEDELTLGMTVKLLNPTDIQCRFPWLRLIFGPQNETSIGEVLTTNVNLSPGNTTLKALGTIARPQTKEQQQTLSQFFADYLTKKHVIVDVKGHKNATSVASLVPALQQLQVTGQIAGLGNDPLLRHATFHLLWSPAVTMTMFNPIPGVNITLWEVEATVFKGNTTIGGNHWRFSDNSTEGLPPPINLPPQQEVTTDYLPVKASANGYKLIREAVGGKIVVDLNITSSVTLGDFPLNMTWLQQNVTVDVNWF